MPAYPILPVWASESHFKIIYLWRSRPASHLKITLREALWMSSCNCMHMCLRKWGMGKSILPQGSFQKFHQSECGQEHRTSHIYLMVPQSFLSNSIKNFKGLGCNSVLKSLLCMWFLGIILRTVKNNKKVKNKLMQCGNLSASIDSGGWGVQRAWIWTLSL